MWFASVDACSSGCSGSVPVCSTSLTVTPDSVDAGAVGVGVGVGLDPPPPPPPGQPATRIASAKAERTTIRYLNHVVFMDGLPGDTRLLRYDSHPAPTNFMNSGSSRSGANSGLRRSGSVP